MFVVDRIADLAWNLWEDQVTFDCRFDSSAVPTHPFAPGRLTLSVAAFVEPGDPLADVVVDPLAPRVRLRRTV